MKGKLLLIPLVAFVVLLVAYATALAECKVFGEVRDREGAIIPRIPVTFSNTKVIKTVTADDMGRYEISLSNGLYKITTQLGNSWNDFERAKINVSCNTKLLINIYSFPKVVEFDNLVDKYHYESLPAPFGDDKTVPVIVFRKKESEGGSTIYSNALITYDKYTLSASKILVDYQTRTVVGKGGAWLENGKFHKEANEIRIGFDDGKIRVVYDYSGP